GWGRAWTRDKSRPTGRWYGRSSSSFVPFERFFAGHARHGARRQAMEAPQYVAARVQAALAEDGRTHELGIRVDVRGDQLFLRGQVSGAERRARLGQGAREAAPGLRVHNEVHVVEVNRPWEDEHLD